MPSDQGKQSVIVVKKKRGHAGGHHGGAWKVAYADFVTSMMAFFLVMWIVAQSAEIKTNVSGYFKDPIGFSKNSKSGMLKGGAGVDMNKLGTEKKDWTQEKAQEILAKAGEHIKEVLSKIPEFEALKDQIKIEMTGEGLRIELIELSGDSSGSSFFFDVGSAKLNKENSTIIEAIAKELGKLPNHVVVEGHTDSRRYPADAKYTNWELSADRANSARQLMEKSGIRSDQVMGVRGYADKKLRIQNNPTDPRNRRISIIVLNEFAEKKYEEIQTGEKEYGKTD